jgi:hypothetical protein
MYPERDHVTKKIDIEYVFKLLRNSRDDWGKEEEDGGYI